MPIVSSRIVRNHNRGNGSLSIHEEHDDHLGIIHEHRYHCDLAYDVNAALLSWVATLEAQLIQNEKLEIQGNVENGDDPALITTKYTTNQQKAKRVVKAMMRGHAKRVIKAAEYISTFTNTQIENFFTVAQRIRIRNRQNYILNNQATLETDEAQREEI